MELPAGALQQLRQLDDLSRRPVPVDLDAGSYLGADGASVKGAEHLLQHMDSEKNYVHMGKYVSIEELPEYSAQVVQILKDYNVIGVRHNEFGEHEIALNANALTVDSAVSLNGAVEVVAI
eukprot:9228005-Pyramimonas_sp.AAC.1